MENTSKLGELLKRHQLNFSWNEEFKYWWLEGGTITGWSWHTGYRLATNESEAKKAAIEYLQKFFVDWD